MPDFPQSSEELQERINKLKGELEQSTAELEKLSKLDVLAFSGGEVDFDDISDEDLREIFDMAMSSDTMNNLPDGYNPKTLSIDYSKQHPYSAEALMNSGISTQDRDREFMIKGIKSLMDHNNGNLTMPVLKFKEEATESRVAILEGNQGMLDGDHKHLVEEGLATEGDDMALQIRALKQDIGVFAQKVEMVASEVEMQREMYPDNILQQAKALLDYEGLTPEQLKEATKEEIELDKKLKSSDLGGEVFKRIEADKNLTHEQKQEIHQKLGKHCMERELDKSQESTILRNATKGTNYMTAYLKTYAKEYNDAILDVAKKELSKVKIPNDSGMDKRFPRVGETPEQAPEVRPDTLDKLNRQHEQVSQKLVQAHDELLHKLSPEAKAFLKSSMEPVVAKNKPELVNLAMSSTLMLKNTAPQLGDLGRLMSQQPGTKHQGDFLIESCKVMQTYSNSLHLQAGSKLRGSKSQDHVAEKLLTQENLSRTKNAYDTLAKGGDRLDSLTTQLANKETDQNLAAQFQPEIDKIAKLEKQYDAMKKGGLWEKFKAIPQGGLEKAKENLLAKIDTAKMDLMMKTDPEGFAQLQEQNKESLKVLKQERSQFVGQKVGHLNASAEVKRLDADLIKDESLKASNLPILSQEGRLQTLVEREIALGEVTENTPGATKYDQLDGDVKALEKNTSVREKLSSNVGQKNEAPKQGVKVG